MRPLPCSAFILLANPFAPIAEASLLTLKRNQLEELIYEKRGRKEDIVVISREERQSNAGTMLKGSYIDHTLLKPEATQKQIDQLCNEAVEHQFATVCIQPCYVKYVSEKYPIRVCTVIGFPLGTPTTQTKVFECQQALTDGAQDIDMVVNVGKVKDGDYAYVQNEIEQLAKLVHSSGDNRILKVIIETCLLNEKEKQKLCEVVGNAGADFIKTSTGFSTGGATLDDIKLLRQYSPSNVQVKASGGVRDAKFARELIQAGATRLGTSSGVALMKDETSTSNY